MQAAIMRLEGKRSSFHTKKNKRKNTTRILLQRCVLVLLLMLLSFLLGRYCAAISREQSGTVLTVKAYLQNPSLPNGCEITTLAAALRYKGADISPLALYSGYLEREEIEQENGTAVGPNPESAYAGDAQSSTDGWYCFEAPLVKAANAFLQQQGSNLSATQVTGADIAQLSDYLTEGTPVIVWVTLNYEAPRFSTFHWVILKDDITYVPYANLHCVLLTGIYNNTCYVSDPLQGNAQVSLDVFMNSYTAMGSRAVVVA